MDPAWVEKLRRMQEKDLTVHAGDIAAAKTREGKENVKQEAYQRMLSRLSAPLAQEQIASDMAGTGAQGEPSFDAAGNLIVSPNQNYQMFNLLPWLQPRPQENINYPEGTGVVG